MNKEEIIKVINCYQYFINDFVNITNDDIEYLLSEVNK